MAYSLSTVVNPFPMPIATFQVDDADSLNHQLTKEIRVRQGVEPSIKRSNVGGWHSASDFFGRQEPAHKALAKQILGMMADLTRRYDPSVDFSKANLIPDGWININPPGAYNSPHDHKTAFWSGAYYVDMPDDEGSSGMIEFLTPLKPMLSNGFIGGALGRDNYALRPTAGTALIFPGSIQHWVHPNLSDSDRVTIGFNGRFRAGLVGGTVLTVSTPSG